MTDTTGIPAFFQGLAAHLIATVNQAAIIQPFEAGDSVHYQGSKVADHGRWTVLRTNPDHGEVVLGRPGVSRMLVVRPGSVRHVGR